MNRPSLRQRLGAAINAFRGDAAPIRPARIPAALARSSAAAAVNRLTADWTASITSADTEARADVVKLRDRARQLERDDPYAAHYFTLLENNVLGSEGIKLQQKLKRPDGSLDTAANKIVEQAWYEWQQREHCTVTRSLQFRDLERIALISTARDGGVLPRLVLGFDNPFGFAIQLLEIDHLDVTHEVPQLKGGGQIRFGIEFNSWREPIAYHLLHRHPGDIYGPYAGEYRRERVSAQELIHLYHPRRALQSIGLPWISSAMLRLKMLNGYEEAELVAARAASCKAGYIEKEYPEGYTGDGEDAAGNQQEDMEPGVIRELDPGQKFVAHDPNHPTTAYNNFTKGVLRGVASGLHVSYNALANDLEGVNYSSIRAGLLEDREEYKKIQSWLICHLHQRIFAAWVIPAILSGRLALPMTRADEIIAAATWKPRRWPWVDPMKDIQAKIEAINNRLESRTATVSEQGGDYEELLDEIASEEKLAREKQVKLPSDHPKKPPGQPPVEDEPERNGHTRLPAFS